MHRTNSVILRNREHGSVAQTQLPEPDQGVVGDDRVNSVKCRTSSLGCDF